MDVVVGGEPIVLAGRRNRLYFENDAALFVRAQRERCDGWLEEGSVIGLDAIVSGGWQIECRRAF